jgi:chaperonin GroEL (HSP60 family)
MNFYKLDKKTGKWDYKLTKSGIPKKVEKSDSIPPSFLDLQLPLDSFPELKNKNVIGWKTVYPISKMENSLLNKSDNMYTLSKTTETNYNLKVTNGRIIKNFLVTPFTIQDAKNQSKVVEHKILKNYLSLLEFQNKMEKKPFVRTVSIQGFGVYNWDIINKSNRIKVFAKVTLPKNISKKKINYFLITPEDKTLVRYEENTLNMFGLPKNKSCFIAILPDNSLYVCNSKKFQNLKVIKNTVYIDLVKSDINISTSSDLTASLKSLF